MPVCSYFLEGRCGAAACPYLHVQVSPSAPACQAFLSGYCPRGLRCTLRHTLVCPSLAAGAPCPNRARCRFHHPAPLLARRARGRDAPQDDDAPAPPKRPRRSMLPAFVVRPRDAETDTDASLARTDD